jgi:UDP-N-acetyl-2-amino-2-deoxyglucuronate dehydrogenase
MPNYVLIGCAGGIARTHLDAIKQIPEIDLVAMSDVNFEAGDKRAEEFGADFFTDHKQMLAEIKPDVAVICTPHPSHPDIALDCFNAGAHVLTEKPMAISVGDADRMIAAAGAADRYLAVNFQQRFRPVIELARSYVSAGMVGELLRVTVIEPWYRPAAYFKSATWRGTWAGEGGGILMNQAPHTLDLLCHLCGRPTEVMGWVRTFRHNIEVEDSAQAMLQFANGAMGVIQVNTVDSGGAQRLEIVGDRASMALTGDTLTMTRFEPSHTVHRSTATEMFSAPKTTVESVDVPSGAFGSGHVALHRDMLEAIAQGRPPRVDGRQGLMSLELANAILLSSHRNAPVTLPVEREAYAQLLTGLREAHKLI